VISILCIIYLVIKKNYKQHSGIHDDVEAFIFHDSRDSVSGMINVLFFLSLGKIIFHYIGTYIYFLKKSIV